MSSVDCDILFAYHIIDIVSCFYSRDYDRCDQIIKFLDCGKSPQFILSLFGLGVGCGEGQKIRWNGKDWNVDQPSYVGLVYYLPRI